MQYYYDRDWASNPGAGPSGVILSSSSQCMCACEMSFQLPQIYRSVQKAGLRCFLLSAAGGIREQSWMSELAELEAALSESRAGWKLVVGHHPCRSNGVEHGDTPELRSEFTNITCIFCNTSPPNANCTQDTRAACVAPRCCQHGSGGSEHGSVSECHIVGLSMYSCSSNVGSKSSSIMHAWHCTKQGCAPYNFIMRVHFAGWVEPLLAKYGVQLYLAGHDHDLEHIKVPREVTHHIVSGTGSQVRPEFSGTRDALFQQGAQGSRHCCLLTAAIFHVCPSLPAIASAVQCYVQVCLQIWSQWWASGPIACESSSSRR